jgi:YD repeat-containing protein
VSNSAVAGNIENWTYGYNDLGDLISADNLGDNNQDQTWSYDLAGNMLTNFINTYTNSTRGTTCMRRIDHHSNAVLTHIFIVR